MHRYLEATGDSFDRPITIQMPVNLRSEDDDKNAGNKLGVALVELASPTDDPCERLTEIGHSLHKVRKQIDSVPGDAIEQFTVLAALAGEMVERLNLSNRLPATGHTLVSNLPGPRKTCYLKGARVEQMCPISVLVPGLHMNITLFSCGGVLNFGIVATKDLPELNLLAQYTREEFHNLEKAVFKPVA
jgi:diacylglycerol O-acyltransferase